MTRRLLWRLFSAFAAVAVVAVAIYSIALFHLFDRFYLDRVTTQLRNQAVLAERVLRAVEATGSIASVQETIRDLGERTGTRFTVILPDGTVAADSEEDPSLMADHGDRPEIRTAFSGAVGVSARYSPTLGKELLYVAIRVRDGSETRFVIRASRHLYSIEEALRPLFGGIVFTAFAVLLLALSVSFLAARRISTAVRKIQEGAERFAAGRLDARLEVPFIEEFARLARSLNTMAADLDARLHEITDQKSELEAILSGMAEAVVLIDHTETVLRINRAAGTLFHVEPEEATGKSLVGILRNRALYAFAEEVLASGGPNEREIDLLDSNGRVLMAHGTIVAGTERMALLVFNDITRLKRLENIRKEFVANVSHELRTPITAIKGFVETLHEGALDDPERARTYIDTIRRHAERLGDIVEDLLSLSRIERDNDAGAVPRDNASIRSLLDAAAGLFRDTARKRGITLTIEGDAVLRAPVASRLIEQAVANLIDNAVKYSPDGGAVTVAAKKSGAHELTITVTDNGIGIAAEHLPRLFERFYRVDKARSRAAGGTGLGLAIVKHIALAHGGSVTVESEPGKGSTFSIHLPI